MSIAKEDIYSVLDTSQLINLFEKNKIASLNSIEFIKKNGFPFLFYEHLLELAKTDDFDLFSKNLCMLEAVDTFKTLKTNDGLPVSIFTLLEDEIYLYSKYGKMDIEILKDYIFENITDCKIKIREPQNLFKKLHKEAHNEAFITILLSNNTNPNFRKKISTLEKNKVILKPMSNIQVSNSVSQHLERLKNKTEKERLEKVFYDYQTNESGEMRKPLEFAQEYFPQGIDKEQTHEDLFYNNMFAKRKQLTIESRKITDKDLTTLTYNSLILNKIFCESQKYLANIYIKDRERKIESSDIYDIYFVCCSVLFKVFVDKRTFDWAKRIENELEIKLILEKNTSKI